MKYFYYQKFRHVEKHCRQNEITFKILKKKTEKDQQQQCSCLKNCTNSKADNRMKEMQKLSSTWNNYKTI